MAQRLILHAGYPQTGAGLLRQWLQDHAGVLAPHLALYGPDHPLVAELRSAALARGRARPGSAAALNAAARALADAVRDQAAPVALVSDENLLGPPPGHVGDGRMEPGLYPGLCPILDGLMQVLAGFDPAVVLVTREAETWLEQIHGQVRHAGGVGDLDTYLAHYAPQLDWEALNDEARFALQGRGRLVPLRFEAEFAPGEVARMDLVRLLEIPDPLLADCRPRLRAPRPAPEAPETPETPAPEAARAAPARPPVPQALVMGGVNALVPEGWGDLLRRDYGALVNRRDRSVTAGTTALGLYRLLAQEAGPPGTPVIWELGINEYVHLSGGQTLDSLLYHVEWLLQLCIRQRRPLVPLLTRSLMQATMERDDPYVARLRALFADYGLTVVDSARLMRVLERGAPAPDRKQWYARNALYDTGTDLPRRMAEAVLMALDAARVPVAPADRAAHFAPRALRLWLPDAAVQEATVGPVSYRFAPFGAPLEITGPDRALALVLIASGAGPAIRLSAGTTALGAFATRIPHGPGEPPQQLRQLILGQDAGGVEIPGGVVQIDRDDSPDRPPETVPETVIVQTMYARGAPPSDPLPAGLVALLGEALREDGA